MEFSLGICCNDAAQRKKTYKTTQSIVIYTEEKNHAGSFETIPRPIRGILRTKLQIGVSAVLHLYEKPARSRKLHRGCVRQGADRKLHLQRRNSRKKATDRNGDKSLQGSFEKPMAKTERPIDEAQVKAVFEAAAK